MTDPTATDANETSGPREGWRLVFAFPSELDVATVSELIALCGRLVDFELEGTRVIGLSVSPCGGGVSLAPTVAPLTLDALRLPFEVIRGDAAGLLAAGLSAHEGHEAALGRATWLIDPRGRVRASLRYPHESARSIKELLRLTMAVHSAEARGTSTPEDWKPGDDEPWPYAALSPICPWRASDHA